MSLPINSILAALRATGQALPARSPIEVLIVGGAAILLTHQGGENRTTSDVDVVWFDPATRRDDVLDAAEAVGRSLHLPHSWMNDWGGLYRRALPPDWPARKVRIGTFGPLTVCAAGRPDLITMKFFARREKDLEDLLVMRPAPDELRLARAHLATLGPETEMALRIIDDWRTP